MYTITTKRGKIEYRVEGHGPRIVLFLHGGHMNASVRLGEAYFLKNGYKVIVASRPGYGGTELGLHRTPDEFTESLKELIDYLEIKNLVVVGISAGGRVAVKLAAKYPDYVKKLILESSISFAPWPDVKTKLAAYVAFNPIIEKYTWKLMRYLIRKNPKLIVKMLLSSMTTQNAGRVINDYSEKQIRGLAMFFANLQSSKGFMNDIKNVADDATDVQVPTLIIHSKYDKSVPLSHPKLLHKQIVGSELYFSEAESHLIFFSLHYKDVKKVMSKFLNK